MLQRAVLSDPKLQPVTGEWDRLCRRRQGSRLAGMGAQGTGMQRRFATHACLVAGGVSYGLHLPGRQRARHDEQRGGVGAKEQHMGSTLVVGGMGRGTQLAGFPDRSIW